MALNEQTFVMDWKKKMLRTSKSFVYGLVVVGLLIACNDSTTKEKSSRVVSLPYYKDASFTPNWLPTNTAETATFHSIPDFNLVNQLGDTITHKTFKNSIYVTDFFFTVCPGICPKMTDNMLILQEAFLEDEEVRFLSHSVTPKRDSVSVLRAYADNKGIIDNKWHLVTGERAEIYDLGRNHYFVEENLGKERDDDDFLHTENFLLIDKNKHIRGIYNGLNKAAINQLIADIKTLKQEG